MIFAKINLPDEDNRIKEHMYVTKASRLNEIIYVDLECLLVNYDTCSNNPMKSHTTNIAQHIPSGYSVNSLRYHDKSSVVTYYRGEHCIQKLCKDLKEILKKLRLPFSHHYIKRCSIFNV